VNGPRASRVAAVVALGVALLVALGAWLWWSGGDGPSLAPAKNGTTRATRADEPLPDPVAAAVPDRQRETTPVEPDAADADATPPAASLLPDGSFLFEGTFALKSPDGAVDPTASGELLVRPLLDGDEPPLVPVAIERGRFAAAVPRAERYHLARIVAAGLPAFAEETIVAAAKTPFAVVGLRPRPTTLVVNDARSGAPLTDVALIAPREPFARPKPEQCRPGELLLDHQPSPFSLPLHEIARDGPLPRQVRWLVTAPGHGFAQVDLDLAIGGERIVTLDLGATLAAVVEPWKPVVADAATGPLVRPPARATVRLRHVDPLAPELSAVEKLTRITQWVIDAEAEPDADGRVRFEGVAPGLCTVSVEVGSWMEEAPALCFESVELAAGESREVTLRPPPIEASGRAAPLAGFVVVPPAWDDRPWALELRSARRDEERVLLIPRAKLERTEGAPGRWRFRVDAATPGPYVARFTELEVQLLFVQPPGGRDDVVLSVAPPVAGRIELHDAATRERIDAGELTVRPADLDPAIGQWRNVALAWDAATRAYPFRLAIGRYELGLDDWRWAEPVAPLAVDPLQPNVAFALERNHGVRVRLRTGATVLPLSEMVERVRLRSPDPDRFGVRYYYEPEWVRIVPRWTGATIVTIDAPDRCVAVPEKTIELQRGEWTELDVAFEYR